MEKPLNDSYLMTDFSLALLLSLFADLLICFLCMLTHMVFLRYFRNEFFRFKPRGMVPPNIYKMFKMRTQMQRMIKGRSQLYLTGSTRFLTSS